LERDASPPERLKVDEAMLWLRWVEPDIARILWARANRLSWKGICCEHAISRATANRRHDYGLAVIVWRLNGKSAPAKRSREFVVARGPCVQVILSRKNGAVRHFSARHRKP
jgi:hypothetical protein